MFIATRYVTTQNDKCYAAPCVVVLAAYVAVVKSARTEHQAEPPFEVDNSPTNFFSVHCTHNWRSDQNMSAPAKSCSTQDVEFAERRDGYPALAAWMSCDLDDETFIFRRFSNLSARNLLHLQAQLVGLEQEIFDADAIARQGGALVSSMRWETMMRFSNDKDRPEHKRVQDLDRLKNLLKDYCMLGPSMMRISANKNRRSLAATITHC